MSRNYTITVPDQLGVGGAYLTDQDKNGLRAILDDIVAAIYAIDERVAIMERGFHSTTTTTSTMTTTSSLSSTSSSSSTTTSTS